MNSRFAIKMGRQLFEVAECLESGAFEDGNIDRLIVQLLGCAVSCGHTKAMEMLAAYCLEGWGMRSPNRVKAGRLLESAAHSRDFSAHVDLAFCCYYGHGVQKDRRKAFLLYRKAAEKGAIRGMYNVGLFYDAGECGVVKQNLRTAFQWYQKAASLGDPDAMFKIAYAYDMGRGVLKDKRTAVQWYRRAAKKGSHDAMWNLAIFYEKGDVVRKNVPYAQRLKDASKRKT